MNDNTVKRSKFTMEVMELRAVVRASSALCFLASLSVGSTSKLIIFRGPKMIAQTQKQHLSQ